MSFWHPIIGPKAAALAPETHARLALACSYWSSDEYEASIVEARRAAGIYGPKRHQRHALLGVTAALTAFVLLSAFF